MFLKIVIFTGIEEKKIIKQTRCMVIFLNNGLNNRQKAIYFCLERKIDLGN